MPTSIPYDPSIVLGGLVDPARIDALQKIAAQQAQIDAAQDNLNSFLMLKRSLQRTSSEIMSLGADLTDLNTQITTVDQKISQAAAQYAQTSVTVLPAVMESRQAIPTVSRAFASPVDYGKSIVLPLPIASDSINLDVQYFRLDGNQQEVSQTLNNLGRFISDSAKFLGDDAAQSMQDAAMKQVSSQMQSREVLGTLVISVSCTHKMASLLEPLVMDVDRALTAWNQTMSTKLSADPDAMRALVDSPSGADASALYVVSGVTYGSSFVGMVHVLSKSETKMNGNAFADPLSKFENEFQREMMVGAAVQGAKGGLGVSKSVAKNVQNLLSSQQLESHVTMCAVGVIPSLKSNAVKFGVQKLADFNAKDMMQQLSLFSAGAESAATTIASAAENARNGQRIVELKNAQAAGVMSSLAQVDVENDSQINLASLMGALDDYILKASGQAPKAAGGVPINYFLRAITTDEIARLWIAKYASDPAPATPVAPTAPVTPTPTPTPAPKSK